MDANVSNSALTLSLNLHFARMQEVQEDPSKNFDSTKALNFCLFTRNQYGMMTEVNQTLKLEDNQRMSSRNFDGGTAAILNKHQMDESILFFFFSNSEFVEDVFKNTKPNHNCE